MRKFLAWFLNYSASMVLVPMMGNPQWVIPEVVRGALLRFPFDKGGTDGFSAARESLGEVNLSHAI